MAKVAIIACGNPLRGDDGVAWRAAEELRRRLPSGQVEIICVHQLAPELAEVVSRADTVIFLDAAAHGEPGQVACHPVSGENAAYNFSHHLTPAGVIAMAGHLYHTVPPAFLISLSGQSFHHGDRLSPIVAAALPRMIQNAVRLATGHSAP